MSIVLHIERLVLDEAVLGGERPDKVRAELERELQRQLSAPGVAHALPGIGSVVSLPACGLPDVKRGHGGLGGRIAAAVGQGLGVESAAHGVGVPANNGGPHG
jgi:hypothetical protein